MKINVGDKLEEITLPDKEGNSFNLSQTLGKKVLLTFKKRQDISSKLTSLRETLLVKDKSKFSYAINKLLSS